MTSTGTPAAPGAEASAMPPPTRLARASTKAPMELRSILDMRRIYQPCPFRFPYIPQSSLKFPAGDVTLSIQMHTTLFPGDFFG